jgi:S-formylglutathione hydrolase FrmB
VRASVMALGLVLGVGTALVPAPVWATEDLPPVSGTTAVAGAKIVGQQWLTQRTLQLTVASPSFSAPVQVEVMLPVGYSAEPTRRWPVTYFLGGTGDDQSTLRTAQNGEALTTSYQSIVVSPYGTGGYWSDWYNNGAGGPPKYETFVTQQLIPLIDANFRTLADRGHRAILGESMGGYGALMTAARHPELFAAASSLSGAVDTNWIPGAVLASGTPLFDLAMPDSIYGPRATNEVNWRGHNPTDLAANLGSVDVQLFTGNGALGAKEIGDPTAPAFCSLEAGIIHPETLSLHSALDSRGVPHKLTTYDWGCHTNAMFSQEIVDSLPRFTEVFAKNTAAPTSFDYRSIEPSFNIFGWAVKADPQRAAEFLDLSDVSNSGLTVTGSGLTRITTPPIFRGLKPVTVLINGEASTVQPDHTGRISLDVNLGQPNQDQQYTFGATTTLHTSVINFLR